LLNAWWDENSEEFSSKEDDWHTINS
jgi:hypothetical protein